MLAKFSVENYRSFNKKLIIDFENIRDYKYNLDCLTNGLLGKMLIYGKNASGKSNLGLALFDIVEVLTDKKNGMRFNDDLTFLNADSDKKVASFEYIFKKDDHYIIYTYEKSTFDTLSYESMKIDDLLVYSYDFKSKKKQFDHLDILNADNLNFDYFENNLPILRYIAYNTSQKEDSIVRFIMDFVSHMLWFRNVNRNEYIGYTTGSEDLEEWIINNNEIKSFETFINKIGDVHLNLGVANVDVPGMPNKILIEKHKNKPLIFSRVSSNGTKALELFFYWGKQLPNVSFLFVDEFDAYYHQELAINIIKYVKKFPNLQAIFTTHNSSLASNSVTRPDCCFMLNNGKLTSFADSTQHELREGHNIEKMLRAGEFNAES